MRRFLFILLLLVLSATVLSANAMPDYMQEKPLFASDKVKIQLTKEAYSLIDIPEVLYADAESFQIADLDSLLSELDVSKVIRAHRKVKDTAWEKQTGFDRWFLLVVPKGSDILRTIDLLKTSKHIEIAIPEYYAYTTAIPNDTFYANNWGHNNTAQLPVYTGGSHSGAGVGTIGFDADMQLAWDQSQGYGSASIVIAIIDTGVDLTHPDLRLVAGYDYGDNDNDPSDNSASPNHGTACSGVAAAKANNGLGITGAAGGCSVMPLKIASADGSLGFTAINNALIHAGDNNVDVASMSFGAEGGMAEGDSPSTDAALEYAYSHGVTLLAATANSNTSAIAYPSNHNKVISVGAASPTGQRKSTTSSDGENWWGSNYGTAVMDASLAVDIMAPTILPATDRVGSVGYSTTDYYMWFNGTSCATPYAAGVAALILSKDPSLTPAQVRTALTTTATDMTIDGGAGWDRYTGYGMVNANAALNSLVPGMPSCTITAPINGTVFDLNSTITVNVTATDTDGTITGVAFYVDDVLKNTDIVSPYTWNWNTTGYSGGAHTIKAIATDNSSNTAQSSISITLLAPPDEGFETGNFSAYQWTQSGNLPWTVQSTDKFSGTYAAKSGAIGDSQTSTLSLTMNITSAGNISFFQKVSSEANYDYLKFYIDSIEQGSWSGAGSWANQYYPVTTGTHTFKWTYSKDANTIGGSDCAYVDHIIFPPYNYFYAPTNLVGTPGNGVAQLTWNAPSGNTPSGYKIYKNSTLLTTTTQLTYNDYAVVNGTTYSYYITATYTSPTGESSPSNTVAVTPSTSTEQTVTIGAGTTTQTYPLDRYYNYSTHEVIYLSSEIIQSGDITKLAYYKASGTDVNPITSVTVYMMHTASNTLASGSYSLTGYTQVYSGNFPNTATSGWMEITLDTPFDYNGTSNLQILILKGNQAYINNYPFWRYSTSTTRARQAHSDDALPTSLTATTNLPNIRLKIMTAPPTVPNITVNPTSLAYGTVMINTSSSNTFTIQNTGTAALTGNITTPAGYTVSLAARQDSNPGENAPAKEVIAEPSQRDVLPYTVAQGTTSTFQVTFAPIAVEAYNGNIMITHDAGGADKTVALTGQGGKPTIGLSATTFSTSLAPGGTNNQTLTVSNSGNLNLTYSLTISGSPAWLTINGGTTLNNTITVGGAAQNITLAYNAAGLVPGVYNATINGNSNDPANSVYNISVTLTVTVPVVITSPAGGENWQGGTSHNITWNYSGKGTTVTLLYSINGGTAWTSLGSRTSNQGTNNYSWTVPYANSTNCKVKIVDSIVPNYEAISNVFTISTPVIVVSVTSIAFGNVIVNASTGQNFIITNTGSAALSGNITTPIGYTVALNGRSDDAPNSNATDMVLKNQSERNVLSYNILGGTSKNYTLTFAPLAVQNYNGNVVITSNDPANPTVNIAVTGAGYIPPTIGLDKTVLTLSLAINADDTDNFTISNSGSQNLTYSIVESPAVAWFSVAPLSGTISGSGSQLITASFSADGMSPGNYQTTLLVNSNDSVNPQKTIQISLDVTNTAPIINLPANFSFDMNGSLVVDCSPYVDDPDGQVLVADYTGNTNINVSIDVPFVTFTAVQDWYGTEDITFSVYDGYTYSYDTVTVTVNLTDLAVPEISNIGKSANGVTIQWGAITNALQYKIYRSFDPYGTYTYLVTTDQTFFEDLEVHDKAFYQVIAVNNPPVK